MGKKVMKRALSFLMAIVIIAGAVCLNIGQKKSVVEAASGSEIRINCGGSQISSGGTVWEAGGNYRYGNYNAGTVNLPGLQVIKPLMSLNSVYAPDDIYRTALYGGNDAPFLRYRVPVSNGNYIVRMHFCVESSENVIFSAYINDVRVIDTMNVQDEVRNITSWVYSNKVAVVKEFVVGVDNGNIDVDFVGKDFNQYYIINGIEIIPTDKPTDLPELAGDIIIDQMDFVRAVWSTSGGTNNIPSGTVIKGVTFTSSWGGYYTGRAHVSNHYGLFTGNPGGGNNESGTISVPNDYMLKSITTKHHDNVGATVTLTSAANPTAALSTNGGTVSTGWTEPSGEVNIAVSMGYGAEYVGFREMAFSYLGGQEEDGGGLITPVDSPVMINQVYGTTGGSISHGFIELYNNSNQAVSLNNYSLQIATGTDRFTPPVSAEWQVLPLTGKSIAAHSSFLVRATGVISSNPRYTITNSDIDWNITVSNRAFSVALVSNQTGLSDVVTSIEAENLIDLVGATNTSANGDLVNNFLGAAVDGITNNCAARRVGFNNTNNNDNDFELIDYRSDKLSEAELDGAKPRYSGDGQWGLIAQSPIIINQVHGTTDGSISHSFVELYNTSAVSVSLNNCSVQIVNGTSGIWTVIPLTGKTVGANQSFLIRCKESLPSSSMRYIISQFDLDKPDVTISNRAFSVALVPSQSELSGVLRSGQYGDLIDLVGVANDLTVDTVCSYLGSPTGGISKQKTARRIFFANNLNNSLDFEILDYRTDGIDNTKLAEVKPRYTGDGPWGQSIIPPELVPDNKKLIFSKEAGFYKTAFNLTLSTGYSSGIIRYTTNGTDPTSSSSQYSSPISIVYNPNTNNNSMAGSLTKPGNSYKGSIIKAQVFASNGAPLSDVYTKSYFINPNYGDFPVFSIVTDQSNLFNSVDGIYANPTDRELEKPAHLEMFEPNGSLAFGMDLGIKIHGGASRNWDQKSFRFMLRNDYSNNSINYDIFAGKAKDMDGNPITSFRRFMLRNGGNDAVMAKMRDPIMHTLAEGMHIPTQANRFSVGFVNGEFWGIYETRERIDDNMIVSKYNLREKANVRLVEFAYHGFHVPKGFDVTWPWGNNVVDGYKAFTNQGSGAYGNPSSPYNTAEAFLWDVENTTDPNKPIFLTENYDPIELESYKQYMNMYEWFLTANLANPGDYAKAQTYWDIDNLIDMNVIATIGFHWDWPGNNNVLWRYDGVYPSNASDPSYGEDGRWRYVLKDIDGVYYGTGTYWSMAVNFDYFDVLFNQWNTQHDGHFNPRWGTLFFQKFWQNDEFKTKFINRLCDLMNTNFKTSVMLNLIDEYVNLFNSNNLMGGQHIPRWGEASGWGQEVSWFKGTVAVRNDIVFNNAKNRLPAIGEKRALTLRTDSNKGYNNINGVDLVEGTFSVTNPDFWSGSYFSNLSQTITAVPESGYEFEKFVVNGTAYNQNPLTLTMSSIGSGSVEIQTYFIEANAVALPEIIINQIYGTTDGSVSHSFVELYNPTDNAVNLDEYSVQIANGTAPKAWNVIALTGKTIQPHHSFLITLNAAAMSADRRYDIPNADMAVSSISVSNKAFSVALVADQTQLSNVITPNEMLSVIDLVGAVNSPPGDAVDNYLGAVITGISKQKSARRVDFSDTRNNFEDFIVIDYRISGINDDALAALKPRWSGDGAWGNGQQGDQPERHPSPLIINQVYSGTTDGNGSISHGFIELYNPTDSAVSLSNYSVQVAEGYDKGVAPVSMEWQVLPLTGETIGARQSFLIRATNGISSSARYTVADSDIDWDVSISNKAFSIALVANQTRLSDVITPVEFGNVIDLVGATNTASNGDAVDNFQGAAVDNISKQRAIRRMDFVDTGNNRSDFVSLDYRISGISETQLNEWRPRWSGDGMWPNGIAPTPQPIPTTIVINQVYGRTTDGAISHGFIELYNTTNSSINLNGYSVQYLTGWEQNVPYNGEWEVLPLIGKSIAAHGSFLIKAIGGTPDVSDNPRHIITDCDMEWNITISNRAFSVALVPNQTRLSKVVTPQELANVTDLIGAVNNPDGGSNRDVVDNFMGAPIIGISKQKAARRIDYVNTGNNREDFETLDYRASNMSGQVYEQVKPCWSGDNGESATQPPTATPASTATPTVAPPTTQPTLKPTVAPTTEPLQEIIVTIPDIFNEGTGNLNSDYYYKNILALTSGWFMSGNEWYFDNGTALKLSGDASGTWGSWAKFGMIKVAPGYALKSITIYSGKNKYYYVRAIPYGSEEAQSVFYESVASEDYLSFLTGWSVEVSEIEFGISDKPNPYVGMGDTNQFGVYEFILTPVGGSAPTLRSSDINEDGQTDASDMAILLDSYGKSGSYEADLNGDGQVDSGDLSKLLDNYGKLAD